MNRILYFSILIIGIFSCNSKNTSNFSINGRFLNAEKDIVYLIDINTRENIIIDSAYISESGKFAFHRQIHENGFYRLSSGDTYVTLLLDTLETIELEADLTNLENTFEVKGSPGTLQLIELEMQLLKKQKLVDSLGVVFRDNQGNDDFFKIKHQIDSSFTLYINNYREFLKEYIDSHLNSMVIYWTLGQELGRTKVLRSDKDFEYFVKIDSALSINYPNTPQSIFLRNWVSKQNRQKLETELIQKRLMIGANAPEIMLHNEKNEVVKLSDFNGNDVLVIFWSSTDKNCIELNKSLKTILNSYKDIKIFSISMDVSEARWLDAIQTNKMKWTNALGNDNLYRIYNIKSIPTIYYIDKDGIIKGKNILPSELISFVKDQYPE